MIIEEQDYICHHGVRGMKWGVRKQKPNTAKIAKATMDNRKKRASRKRS